MKHIKSIYIYICMGIITIGSILFGYWYFIDGEFVNIPITSNTLVVQTEKEIYQIGDPVAVKWNYCKGVSTTSTISINLIDGIVYMLPNGHSTRPIGCYDNYTVVTEIPKAIPTGNYHLEAVIHFRVNPVKNIDYKASSNTFRIDGGNMQE
jgi:hypothetical protein